MSGASRKHWLKQSLERWKMGGAYESAEVPLGIFRSLDIIYPLFSEFLPCATYNKVKHSVYIDKIYIDGGDRHGQA